MSPEDDPTDADRIPNHDEMPRGWNPISQTDDTSLQQKRLNGHNKTSPAHENGKNGVNNKMEKQTLSPLLQKENSNNSNSNHNNYSNSDPHNDSETEHKSNNNEWAANMSTNLKIDMKNGWKEIPQAEAPVNGSNKINGNGMSIRKNNLVHDTNGHSEKLAEQDPLTGSKKQQDIDELSSCGIGSCQPKWALKFASTHAFMVVFLLAWILQV